MAEGFVRDRLIGTARAGKEKTKWADINTNTIEQRQNYGKDRWKKKSSQIQCSALGRDAPAGKGKITGDGTENIKVRPSAESGTAKSTQTETTTGNRRE